MRKFRIISLIIYSFVVLSPMVAGSNNTSSQEVVVFTNDWSPLLSDYFRSVMTHAVRYAEEYPGQYTLQFKPNGASPFRIRQLAAENGSLYFDFSAESKGVQRPDPITHISRRPYKIPLLKGLLGLRKAIIKKTQLERFDAIKNVKAFRRLKAGQVGTWPDVLVYESAGVEVRKSRSYRDLFPMLHAGRFDYLPLGIVEVHGTRQKQTEYLDDFYIPDDIYIFYSIPIYVNVLRNTEQSALSIIESIRKIIENGELDKIFVAHFGKYIREISPSSAKVFVFENPVERKKHNKNTIDKALELYFNNEAQVFFLNE